MSWHANLSLNYRRDGEHTRVADRHTGPLRILHSLYPEGPGICHNVVVHPPAGIAGGDRLNIDIGLGEHSHAVLTTPGATRFYKSHGLLATQTVKAQVADGARLEWLPLETLLHPQTFAENSLCFELAPQAEMIGWDVLALGLPASGQPFDQGRFTQEIHLPGVWLERGTIDGADELLRNSPLGFAGKTALGTMWFSSGSDIADARADTLLETARSVIEQHAIPCTAGVSQTDPRVLVLRVLADRVEPAMRLMTGVWQAWRQAAWQMDAPVPRVWRT